MAKGESTSTLSLEHYDPGARALVAAAQAQADERRHAEVQPLHLLSQALERSAVVEAFRRAGANLLELPAATERALALLPSANEPAYLSSGLLELMQRAKRDAEREHVALVTTEHLLNALSQEIRGPAGDLLTAFNVGPGALRPHLRALKETLDKGGRRPNAPVEPTSFTRDLVAEARRHQLGPIIGLVTEQRRVLTILERRYKNHPLLIGEPGVGKRSIVSALANRIARADVPATLLTAKLLEINIGVLVAGARLRGELEERVNALLKSVRSDDGETILVVHDLEQLFGQGPAGAQVGDLLKPALLTSRVRFLGTVTPDGLRRLEERDPSILRLFTSLTIDEPSSSSALEIVRGVVARYEKHHGVQITEGAIAAAVRMAKRYVQDRFLPDAALDLVDETAATKRVETDGVPAELETASARLESVQAQLESLAGASDGASVAVHERLQAELDALAPKAKNLREQFTARRGAVTALRALQTELRASEAALEAARNQGESARQAELQHVTLPDLRRRADAAEQAARASGVGSADVTESDVAATLAVWSGIPVAKILQEEAEKLLKMEAGLAQRVVGQDAAVSAIARAVRRGRVGLRDPGKPIGSFLFLGPSGVGKTELAKALAELLFDDEQALTRLDMSEFAERHMAQRLIGAPPGYADSDQGGFLTEAVRRRPYSVLLFDEVEKAHQDVFNLLLQVLDDGRLTDGRGRLADFSNSVIILTSNIASERILQAEPRLFENEAGREALFDVILQRLGEFFRPEFLNRIDEVIVFRPLTQDHLRAIVEIQLRRLEELLSDRRLKLQLSEPAKALLVEKGYEPALGARPLKRVILKQLQDPLAEALLRSAYPEGSTILVDTSDTGLTFTIAPTPTNAESKS